MAASTQPTAPASENADEALQRVLVVGTKLLAELATAPAEAHSRRTAAQLLAANDDDDAPTLTDIIVPRRNPFAPSRPLTRPASAP